MNDAQHAAQLARALQDCLGYIEEQDPTLCTQMEGEFLLDAHKAIAAYERYQARATEQQLPLNLT